MALESVAYPMHVFLDGGDVSSNQSLRRFLVLTEEFECEVGMDPLT